MLFALAGAIGIGVLAAGVTTAKLEHPWPQAEGAAIAKAAATDPSLRVLAQESYADWLLWRFPSLRGKIAFDIRFELLGDRGLKDVVGLEVAAGPTWNRPFAGYRLELWNRELKPELVAALLAEPGTRVLSHHDHVYAILRASPGAARHGLTLALAASSVLCSSMAIVIGPTPPGTGVIADATSVTGRSRRRRRGRRRCD